MELFDHQGGPTLGTMTERTLTRYKDRTAFSWEGGSITYGDLLTMIARYQKVLSDAGLQKGRGVAALGANRMEVWALGQAVMSMGAYITWLHPMGSLADQIFQIGDSEASMLVVDERHYAARGAELAAHARGEGLTALSMSPSDFADDLESQLEAAGDAPFLDVGQATDLCIINYTGGTTGQPKGASRRHFQSVQGVIDVHSDFNFPWGAIYLAVAPISHVAGTKIIPTLLKGGRVHLLNGFDPGQVLEVLEREKVTVALFVPTMIYALLDHPDLDKRDLSSLEMVLYGASPMSVARLEEGMRRIGPVFAQLYGQTECYPATILRQDDHDLDHPERLLSCGQPVAGVAVSIRNMANEPVAVGEIGEVCLRGSSAMDGYWRRPELSEETLAGGWLHTGDIGRVDEDGYVYIVDRKKDMIISGGFNVFPREIEDALTAHADVAAAAVYGVPDEKWGERVTASVILKAGGTASEDDLIAHVKELKGSVQAPKLVEIVPDLPQTAVGKIDKKALRARMEGQ